MRGALASAWRFGSAASAGAGAAAIRTSMIKSWHASRPSWSSSALGSKRGGYAWSRSSKGATRPARAVPSSALPKPSALATAEWQHWRRPLNVTDLQDSPWWVVEADDKRHARISCISHFLSMVSYEDLTPSEIELPAPQQPDPDYVRPALASLRLVPRVLAGASSEAARARGASGTFGKRR